MLTPSGLTHGGASFSPPVRAGWGSGARTLACAFPPLRPVQSSKSEQLLTTYNCISVHHLFQSWLVLQSFCRNTTMCSILVKQLLHKVLFRQQFLYFWFAKIKVPWEKLLRNACVVQPQITYTCRGRGEGALHSTMCSSPPNCAPQRALDTQRLRRHHMGPWPTFLLSF